MTFRVGDTATLPIKLQTSAGAALSYASLSAFLADSWSIESTILGAAVTMTASSLIRDPGSLASGNFDGLHLLTVTLPGPGLLVVKANTTNATYLSAFDLSLVVGIADEDSLSAQISSGLGTLVAGGSVSTVNDLNWVEGDGLQAQFTVPVSALQVFDLTNKLVFSFASLADVSATAWTIAAQARYITENGELPTQAVAFTFGAFVLDKVNNKVAIGWQTPPAGAIVDDLLPTAPTVTVSGGLITGTTGGTGGHIYGTNPVTVTLTGGGGTGGILTPVIVNGVITGYTVTAQGSGYGSAPTAALSVASDGNTASRKFAYDIQLVPPSGSPYTAKLTVISGYINVLRQQTTSP